MTTTITTPTLTRILTGTASPGLGSAPGSAALPVVVIGAGPVGLAAAANLVGYGLPVVVLEAGEQVGHAVRQWGHVRTFTPWRYIVDERAEALLSAHGWARPDTPVPPTGAELAESYLQPLAAALGDRVRVNTRVVAVSREGMDKTRTVGRAQRPLLVRVRTADGALSDVAARAVIDASGTWSGPNPLGSSGLALPGEAEATERGLLVGGLPDVLGADVARYAGRRTLVVGSGHSAANTLLALGRVAAAAPGTQLWWAVRGGAAEKVYGGGPGDELPERGRLGTDLRALVASGAVRLLTGFTATAVRIDPDGRTVTVVGTGPGGPRQLTGLHTVVAATGFRPDVGMLAELQLDLDPALEAPRVLAPLVDPQFHSCGTVPPHGHRELTHPEPGSYTVGMKSYGRAPTFLITTGNEQVRSIAAALAGDTAAAADRVQLVLPDSGVCSVGPAGQDTTAPTGQHPAAASTQDTAAAGGCCGTPPAAHRDRPAGVPAQGLRTGRGRRPRSPPVRAAGIGGGTSRAGGWSGPWPAPRSSATASSTTRSRCTWLRCAPRCTPAPARSPSPCQSASRSPAPPPQPWAAGSTPTVPGP